ncbi:hypothetical protein CL614_03640 [archaeon]|jgi:hypothetical protein|nr:hypothetical protein [archaeon]|tara:strand:+ start:2277 stop:2603 length:327 start_codon:yes stop_codon:yes gene_type:complete
MQKQVEIEHKDRKLLFNLKPLTWGDLKRIRNKSVVIQDHRGQPMQFRDIDKLEDLKIVRSIESVTCQGQAVEWNKTIEQLDELTPKNRVALLKAVKEMDDVSLDEGEA